MESELTNSALIAVKAVREGSVPSVRQASRLFNVNRNTIHRLKRKRTAKELQQARQRLSTQEESIKRCIYTMTAWGWPATIRYLKSLATGLLKAKGDLEPLGQNWYKKYLDRHPDLKVVWSRTLDQSRKDASDYSNFQHWFELYQKTCTT